MGAVFIFTFIAAVLVLLGVLQGQRVSRSREIALFKTMGASRHRIRAAIVFEFLLIGGLSGALGAGLALVSGWVLANEVFEFSYQPSWLWFAGCIVLTAVAVTLSGLSSIAGLFKVLPVRLLAR